MNKKLFKSAAAGKAIPVADIVNEAGGAAYALSDRGSLAQLVITGTLNQTYYATADAQLKQVLEFAQKVDSRFIGQLAVYARQRGFMKDTPALLVAVLADRSKTDVEARSILRSVFPRAIDNVKMLRNFVQIIRSGQVGRKSFGTAVKALVRDFLTSRSPEALFRDSVGQSPSLGDIIRMVYPPRVNAERGALYDYLRGVGNAETQADLPSLVRQFEAFKKDTSREIPKVPFQFLTNLELSKEQWAEIARNGGFQMVRMNLNTFARHGAFDVNGVAESVAAKLRDREQVQKSRVFPYQLLMAFKASETDQTIPKDVRLALQDAMELAIENFPAIEGKVVVCPDISGSMNSPVTGNRKGATTRVTCRDVAALVASTVLRKNPDADVLPFHTQVERVSLNPRDSVMTNAQKLANLPSGGTACQAPLIELNSRNAKVDVVILVSDNQSWASLGFSGQGTATMAEWTKLKARNPRAKLVVLDINPYAHTQAKEREDILNVGGYSDSAYEIISLFVNGELDRDHWVGEISKVEV